MGKGIVLCAILAQLIGCSPTDANPRREQAARIYYSKAPSIIKRQVDGMLYGESLAVNAEIQSLDLTVDGFLTSLSQQMSRLSKNIEKCSNLLIEKASEQLESECRWLESNGARILEHQERIRTYISLQDTSLNIDFRRSREKFCDKRVHVILLGSAPSYEFYEYIDAKAIRDPSHFTDEEHERLLAKENELQKNQISETKVWIESHPLTDETFVERGKDYCANRAKWEPLEEKLNLAEQTLKKIQMQTESAFVEIPILLENAKTLSVQIRDFLAASPKTPPPKPAERKTNSSKMSAEEKRQLLKEIDEELEKLRRESQGKR